MKKMLLTLCLFISLGFIMPVSAHTYVTVTDGCRYNPKYVSYEYPKLPHKRPPHLHAHHPKHKHVQTHRGYYSSSANISNSIVKGAITGGILGAILN